MTKIITVSGGVISAIKGPNTDFLTTDLVMVDGREFDYWEIFVEMDVEKILKYTRDGTNFKSLNSDTALKADSGYVFAIPAQSTDTFNLQYVTGTDTTIVGLIRGIRES